MAIDDRTLVSQVSDGDVRAFESLVARYEARLIRYVRSLVRDEEKARELVQDTFVKLHRYAHRYEPKASFATWLFRIAHNVAVSYLRKKKLPLIFGFGNHDPETNSPTADVATDVPSPHREAEGHQLGEIIQAELMRLPDKLREAFVLFDIEELSIREIAEVTGSPEGTVKARIFRARRALRVRLQPYRKHGLSPKAALPVADGSMKTSKT